MYHHLKAGTLQGTVAIALCFSATMGSSQTAKSALPPAVQHKSFPIDFALGNSAKTFPVLTNGFLLSHMRVINRMGSKDIYATSLSSKVRTPISFWLEGASVIHLDDVAITSANHVLVAGSYLSPSNSDDTKNFQLDPRRAAAHNFIAEIDLVGHVLETRDLLDYTPERLCAVADGSYWTFGQVWAVEMRKMKERDEYSMLRHYSSGGELIESYMPRSVSERNSAPNYRHTGAKAYESGAFLACNSTSAVAYLQTARGFAWTTVDTASKQTATLLTHPPKGSVPTGLAYLSAQTSYASFRKVTLVPGTGPVYGEPIGIFQLVAHKHRARWLPIASGEAGSIDGTLLGSDAGCLVHLEGQKPPSIEPTLYWTKAPA